jgi:hypothetical protein
MLKVWRTRFDNIGHKLIEGEISISRFRPYYVDDSLIYMYRKTKLIQ